MRTSLFDCHVVRAGFIVVCSVRLMAVVGSGRPGGGAVLMVSAFPKLQ